MHKGEVNSDQVSARVDDGPQRDSSDISGGYDSTDFDNHTGEKSERIHLDALLPFLEERIAFEVPSELKHLDGVLDYLNERMLRLGIVMDEVRSNQCGNRLEMFKRLVNKPQSQIQPSNGQTTTE